MFDSTIQSGRFAADEAIADGGRSHSDDTATPPRDPSGATWKTLLVIVLYTAPSFVYFRQIWSSPRSVIQIGSDQFNFTWLLKWTPWALTHFHNPFYSNYLNFPFGVNLLANAGVTGLGILFAPVTWLFGPVVSFNTIETLSLPLSALGAYFFISRWVHWRPAAFVGGLLYGFSPYQFAQIGHINLTNAVLPPLILLVLHEAAVRQKWTVRRTGLSLGGLCIAQYFISSELLFDTALVGLISLVVVAVIGRESLRPHLDYFLRAVLLAGLIALAVLAYPIAFSLFGPAHISGPVQPIAQAYRSDLLSPIIPDSRMLLSLPHLAQVADNYSNSAAENGSYLGISLLIILVVGAIALWRVMVVRVSAIVGAASFVLSLGAGLTVNTAPSLNPTGLPLPGLVIDKIPLLSNDIPSRFSLFCALFAAVILGVVLDRAHRMAVTGSGRHASGLTSRMLRGGVVAPGLIALFVLVPLLPAPLSGFGPTRVPALFGLSGKIPPGSTAVIYPFPSTSAPDSTLWQADGGMRFRQPGTTLLVPDRQGNVSVGRVTTTSTVLIKIFDGEIPPTSTSIRTSILNEFRQWHVRSFVAFPLGTANASQALSYFSWLFGRPPQVTPSNDPAYGWYHLREATSSPSK